MNAFDYLFTSSIDLDKNFVLGHNEDLAFRNLHANSLKVAEFLKDKIGENQHVLLISSNSVFFITAYLGIIKSGNICVPVTTTLEQKNLYYILSITNCSCVFLNDSLSAVLKFPDLTMVDESGLAEILIRYKQIVIPPSDTFNDSRTALVMFTSGSTGNPKGVIISHLNIISNTKGIIDALQLSSKDIMGVVLPFSYCYGLSLLHTHLRVGGSLVLINNFFFLGTVIRDLREFKCTGFAGVPSHFQILIRKSQSFLKTTFPDLTYVTQAGGKLHDIFIDEFTLAFPEVKFYVMYGQTEATARLAILPPHLLKEKKGSVGKALPGIDLKIVNEEEETVTSGEVGEVLAKGDSIMKGYFQDQKGTEMAIKNGWLYTGDLARMDEDGFLFLVGRKKEILKVGGRRISPKEIEEVILYLPQILDCTIQGVYDEILGEAIKAIVVVEGVDDQTAMKKQILKTCHENLAVFKVPQLIEFKDQLELSSAGKKILR